MSFKITQLFTVEVPKEALNHTGFQQKTELDSLIYYRLCFYNKLLF